ncbi:MAG: MarR family transcriptional regulator [Clostridiales bacterium]|jgi:DNA-binding MarR family transcriptional regulator|nr:MarR family transcriptional regulator [Clostridiales bacterium]
MNNKLYAKLAQLKWLLHKRQFRDYRNGGLLADTSRGQGRILAALKLKDGVTAKELAYILGLHIASLNEMLAKLAKNGYVTREQLPDDKRVILVRLTDKGRSELQAETPNYDGIFECLSEGEQKTFGDYLDRIIAALRTNLGFDDDEMPERFRAACGERENGFEERDFGHGFGKFGGFGHGFGKFDGFGHGFGGRNRDGLE